MTKNWSDKNDKYKIWCPQLQEESLTENLNIMWCN